MIKINPFTTSEQLDLATVKKRAIVGAASLTFRRIALQAITFISINLILARIYPPESGVLGIFNLSASIIAFFSYFSDIGLAASLIQKKEAVTYDDLKTTFTIQEILVGIITLTVFFAAPQIASYYNLETAGMWLIRGLAVAFFLSSLKVIPSVLLERELKFNPLVSVEIIETVIFNLILLTLAFSNFGLYSFTIAVIIRSIIGTTILYLIAPWNIAIGISRTAAKGLLSFGIPYQTNTLLALIKDRIVPLFVAKIVGPVGLSYVTWAQAIAFLPLEIMNIIIRVTFPAYSRLQDNKQELKLAIEKSLYVTTLFLYPMLFGLLAVAPSLVSHVVSEKWAPALPSLYFFTFSTFWATISTTFTNALNAIGQIKVTLKLMIFWTIITWILTPIFVFKYGFVGVAVASAIISFTSIITIIILKKFVPVSIISSIKYPLLSSAIMAGVVYILAKIFITGIFTFIIMIFFGAIFYFGLIFIIDRQKVVSELKGVMRAIV
jgi:O-antigen/teichoic acid export membrane protein